MARVFISYARGSRDYARRLSLALREVGIHAYFVSDAAKYGDSIPENIRTTMKSNDLLVVLLTQQAVKSRFIEFEIGAAEALGKQVIPILLTDVDRDSLNYLTSDLLLDGRKLSPRQIASRIKALKEFHD
jgi:hypothetical protein